MWDVTKIEDRGEYVFYNFDGERKFVARFKRGGKRDFMKFLTKNTTPKMYFDAMDAGKAPVTILNELGFIAANVKKILKSLGYPPSQVGLNTYLADQRKKRTA